MTNWKLFDQYSLRARLQPALLTLLPAAIGVFAWAGPGVKWQSALWTLFGTAGGTCFLAIVARNFGKKIENGLWQSWGGSPTTQLLRHSGSANPVMRDRWHKSLAKLLGRPFPTAQEEAANPNSADDVYGAAARLQINKTHDTKKYPLVFKENMHYGFCRNLYAMRAIGITVAILGIVASCAAGIWSIQSGNPDVRPWVCAVVCTLMFLLWVFVVKPSWVRVPAFAYAERLLESVENTTRAGKTNSTAK